jgi:hypothetical protein
VPIPIDTGLGKECSSVHNAENLYTKTGRGGKQPVIPDYVFKRRESDQETLVQRTRGVPHGSTIWEVLPPHLNCPEFWTVSAKWKNSEGNNSESTRYIGYPYLFGWKNLTDFLGEISSGVARNQQISEHTPVWPLNPS